MNSPLVLVDNSTKDVIRLTLNRPEKRNALSIKLMEELLKQLQRIPETCRIVLLEGAGNFFCAGLDLAEGMDPKWKEKSSELVSKCLISLSKVPCALVAYVRGGAMAGGLGLMSACDIVITSRDSVFALPELRRGLIPALVYTLLSSQISKRFLHELIMTGEPITAVHAHTIGLVNQVISPEEKEKTLKLLFESILKAAPQALKMFKRSFPFASEKDFELSLALHQEVRNGEEAEEGMKAFIEKRAPHWFNP